MNSMIRALVGAVFFACIAVGPACAQSSYPSRPVRIVVGAPPGGPTDLVGRLLAEKLATAFPGSAFIVDNKPGAGFTIASEYVAKAKADGYTLLLATLAGQALSPTIYSKLRYDPAKDLQPIAMVASAPNVLAVKPSFPARNIQELVAQAKANPGKFNYASTSIGTTQHLAMELFLSTTATQITAISYRGAAPAVIGLLGGQTDMIMDNTSSIGSHLKSGKLRALAVTSAKRVTAFPDIPTMAEAGLASFEVVSWFGLMAPTGTPQEIIYKLSQAASQIAKSPAFSERLVELGATPEHLGPEEFGTRIRADVVKWAPVIKAAAISAD